MDLVQDLQRHGWYLSEGGIKECSKSNSVTAQEIIQEALNTDLRQIGEKHLPESLGKSKAEFVDGPFVLQIQKVRNVAIPKDSEQSDSGHKLYRLTLTDGPGTCTAVATKAISGLSHATPPGSKVKLLGRVPVNHGFLLFDGSNCKILGGRVEKLVESWELKKALATQNRASVNQEGGPPPFIPFGQRRKDVVQTTNKKDTFRSLDSAAKKKETDGEFEQQRKATIEAALQEGKAKGFGSISAKQVQAQDRSVASMIDMGFSAEQSSAALKKSGGNLEAAINSLFGEQPQPSSDNFSARRSTNSRIPSNAPSGRPQLALTSDRPDRPGGRRRGGRSEETEDYNSELHAKPSAPATLFDFVTTIIPKKSGSDTKSSSKSSNSVVNNESAAEKPQDVKPDDIGKPVITKQRHRSPEGASGDHASHDESHEKFSDGTASSANQSGAGHGSNYHSGGTHNLPPRLQKKQMRDEEEKMYKFVSKDSAMSDWSRDRMSNKVYDVNSRGPVSNKNLWLDDKDERGRERRGDRHQRGKDGGGGGKMEGGRTGERALNEKNYQRNGVAYEGQGHFSDGSASQQPIHVLQEMAPLVSCTPGTVTPLMQCTTDGMQLVQSMSALHLYPAAPVQVAPAFVQGLAAVPSSVICDGQTGGATKEGNRWKTGDFCMAKWEDKEFYRAKIIKVDSKVVVVNFVDYGNEVSSLPYSDIRPMRQSEGGGGGGSWFQSAGFVYSAPDHGQNIVYPSRNGHYGATPVATTPATGMIVQGPGAYPAYPVDQSYRIVTNTGRSNGPKQTKRPNEKQLYVPPSQRK